MRWAFSLPPPPSHNGSSFLMNNFSLPPSKEEGIFKLPSPENLDPTPISQHVELATPLRICLHPSRALRPLSPFNSPHLPETTANPFALLLCPSAVGWWDSSGHWGVTTTNSPLFPGSPWRATYLSFATPSPRIFLFVFFVRIEYLDFLPPTLQMSDLELSPVSFPVNLGIPPPRSPHRNLSLDRRLWVFFFQEFFPFQT